MAVLQNKSIKSGENNVGRFLSDEDRLLFELVNFVFISFIVSTLGVIANVINMIVFVKQGFKNTVNIGFFGLAISDTSCLLTLIWGSICMNPALSDLTRIWFQMEVMYLTSAWPHSCFCRTTTWITVYITAERFLSIALPLKVKNIITPRVTILLLCMIYVVNLFTLVPEFVTSYLGWRFFPSINKTLIGIQFTDSREKVEGISFFLHFTLGVVSFVGVIVFTCLLVIKLGQNSQWRRKATSNHSNHDQISTRDKKTVKMVVFIACVLIICYTPSSLFSLVVFVVGPEFSIRGRYVNLCEAMFTTTFAIQSINSSVNIFVYYSMSTKYRVTFAEVMQRCRMFPW